MSHERTFTMVAVNGHQVSLSFAECENPAAIGQVKQILLSSYAAHTTEPKCRGILAISPRQRDNEGRGKAPMHLDNFINSAQ